MHGLINKALQRFAVDTYGTRMWEDVVRGARLPFTDFEPMLDYDPDLTEAVLDALSARLGRARANVLEDVGTYLVSHPGGALRRLLRFSGAGYEDFLHSLDEMPDRARLAVSDLILPALELTEPAPGRFRITCHSSHVGFGHVLIGILRAMADDYGALATVEHAGYGPGREVVEIDVVEAGYAAGRHFVLSARAG